MNRYFVLIQCAGDEEWQSLRRRTDLDLFRSTARRLPDGRIMVDGLLSSAEIDQLLTPAYLVEIKAEADQIAAERKQEVDRTDEDDL
ncbi:MAG: hypothetical protein U0X20_24575 [Caldilineaceae bacterium]